MTRRIDHRLDKVTRRVEAMPVPTHVVNAAVERLRDFGELPENGRLAAAVVHRVLIGEMPQEYVGDKAATIRHLVRITVVTEPTATPLREVLFDEAVHGPDFVRRFARTALKLAAFRGEDVTAPGFLANVQPPEFGTLGMHLVGFPYRFVRPPYERQAERLWDRYAELRRRIDQADDGWMDRFAQAVMTFRSRFELPDDDLLRVAVLADLELQAVLNHGAGRDVRELMELLDRAVMAMGQQREAAIAQVVAFVRRSPPPEFAVASPGNG